MQYRGTPLSRILRGTLCIFRKRSRLCLDDEVLRPVDRSPWASCTGIAWSHNGFCNLPVWRYNGRVRIGPVPYPNGEKGPQ